jgi:hypothetical protein
MAILTLNGVVIRLPEGFVLPADSQPDGQRVRRRRLTLSRYRYHVIVIVIVIYNTKTGVIIFILVTRIPLRGASFTGLDDVSRFTRRFKTGECHDVHGAESY